MTSPALQTLLAIIKCVDDSNDNEWNSLTPNQMLCKIESQLFGLDAALMKESMFVVRGLFNLLGRALFNRYGSLAVIYAKASNGEISIMSLLDYSYKLSFGETLFARKNKIFHAALEQAGFKGQRDCTALDLIHEYRQYEGPAQQKLFKNLTNRKYPYKAMRYNRASIKEGLHMYLYHPSRVAKWLEENPDKELEEYLV